MLACPACIRSFNKNHDAVCQGKKYALSRHSNHAAPFRGPQPTSAKGFAWPCSEIFTCSAEASIRRAAKKLCTNSMSCIVSGHGRKHMSVRNCQQISLFTSRNHGTNNTPPKAPQKSNPRHAGSHRNPQDLQKFARRTQGANSSPSSLARRSPPPLRTRSRLVSFKKLSSPAPPLQPKESQSRTLLAHCENTAAVVAPETCSCKCGCTLIAARKSRAFARPLMELKMPLALLTGRIFSCVAPTPQWCAKICLAVPVAQVVVCALSATSE